MANIKSAKKRAIQAEVRRERNVSQRSTMRTQVKSLLKILESGKIADVQTEFRKTASALDKAARKGLIHKNTAARKKSRLNKRIKMLAQQQTAVNA